MLYISYMPFAHVVVPAGALSVEKKQKIVELVTDAIVAAEEAPPALRPYVTVLVSEAAEGGWGIGGRGYTGPELRGLVREAAARGTS
ncbi:tautomerase family protein [Vulcanimicrobium alpinum]|uniref:tautomerase family protein n=1 Tax=Vulcanimicrobium alpinum TaxID=3016050 RepID=UPI00295ECCCC|nr:tautomerase family protein [Vulcanimicrobium alpinum]